MKKFKAPNLDNKPIEPINEEANEASRQLFEATEIKSSIDVAPTYTSKTYQEQEAYYSTDLYKNIDNSWVKFIGDISFTSPLSESGGSVTLSTVPVNKGGTNITSYTAGDVLYASGSTALAKLAKGTEDYGLVMGASIPKWAAIRFANKRGTWTASDNLEISADTTRGEGFTTYAKLKEILVRVDYAGIARVKFDLRTTNSGITAYGRIYKDGVVFGTERSTTSTTFVTYSQDIAVEDGELIQVYARLSAYSPSQKAEVKNFRFYFDRSQIDDYKINTN